MQSIEGENHFNEMIIASYLWEEVGERGEDERNEEEREEERKRQVKSVERENHFGYVIAAQFLLEEVGEKIGSRLGDGSECKRL